MLNFKKGDTLTFGKYYQENSAEKKLIKWTVLDSSDDKVLLLSKYVIDAKPYNSSLVNTTWERCSLRTWLNGEFATNAFSLQEKNLIVTTRISTPSFKHPFRVGGGGLTSNPNIVPGGNDVNDKIFLLSFEEVKKYFKQNTELNYVLKAVVPWASDAIINDVAGVYPELKCNPTNFAKSKNVYGSDKEGAWWWFRSPGNTSQMATSTMNGIILYHPGVEVNDTTLGIRPALWVKKEAFYTDDEKREIAEKEALRKRKLEEERKRQQVAKWKNDNLCQYCGNKFKGVFSKKCRVCGIKKDY
ncbi:MAG: hypothetical protein E7418_01890 [Ruminococcaceae bacterium]|nr:hypothetical protein [Oscillospiraceae bacterium]